MLFSWIPVPGTTKPDVTPLEVVIEATIPSASTALTCVVPVAVSGVVAPLRRWIVAATSVSTSPIHPRASSGSNGGAAASVSAMIEPPNDGGGLVKNWWPARSETTGSRWITW